MTKEDLIERLADAEHASWARWMDYLFSQCTQPAHTNYLIIPGLLVERWKRQAATPYADLTEREKQSDRDEVAHILPAIEAYAGPYNTMNPFDLMRPHADGVSPPSGPDPSRINED